MHSDLCIDLKACDLSEYLFQAIDPGSFFCLTTEVACYVSMIFQELINKYIEKSQKTNATYWWYLNNLSIKSVLLANDYFYNLSVTILEEPYCWIEEMF